MELAGLEPATSGVTLPFAATVRIAAAAAAYRSVDDANMLFSAGAG